MVVLSVFILLIVFEPSKVLCNAFNTYCSLPCPFMCPAQAPSPYGVIQIPPRRPNPQGRTSLYDTYTDYDDDVPEEPQPPPQVMKRGQRLPNPDSPAPHSPPAKPKPKPPPEDSEPPPKKKGPSPSPSSPSIQPTRRFFTSLFSIPGAIVDTLISGEVVL